MKRRRNTRQREIILQAASERCDHPTADQIYLALAPEHPRISRGTVYRNLKLLAESGQLQQLKIPGADRFDRRVEQHAHLSCVRCQSVCDVDTPYDAGLDEQAARETGCRVTGHHVLFEGVCPACLAQDGNG